MKSIKKDVENLSFSSLALTESAWEALVVLYKDWPVWLPLARSCASGWDSSSLTAPDDIWHHREENQQPSKHQDQTSHTATSCVLCWRGLGNASPAAQQKKMLIYVSLTPLTVHLQPRLATLRNNQTLSATIPIPKCSQTFLVLHAF